MVEHIGNFSSAPLARSVELTCEHCRVRWTGCAAAVDCPRCGQPVDLPNVAPWWATIGEDGPAPEEFIAVLRTLARARATIGED